MAIRNQLPPWHEKMHLANGREVLIRPVRPEDATILRATFPLFEPQSVAKTFQSSDAELGVDDAARLAQPDPKNEFVLVATEPYEPGEAMIFAMVRGKTEEGSDEAEFHVLVGRNVLNLGLGRHLLSRLSRWTKGRGISRMVGDLPQENSPILDHADSLGFQRQSESEESGLVRVVLDGGASAESEAPH